MKSTAVFFVVGAFAGVADVDLELGTSIPNQVAARLDRPISYIAADGVAAATNAVTNAHNVRGDIAATAVNTLGGGFNGLGQTGVDFVTGITGDLTDAQAVVSANKATNVDADYVVDESAVIPVHHSHSWGHPVPDYDVKDDYVKYPVIKDDYAYPVVKDDYAKYPVVKDDYAKYPVVKDDYAKYPVVKDDYAKYPVVKDDYAKYPVVKDGWETYPAVKDDWSKYPVVKDLALGSYDLVDDGVSSLTYKHHGSDKHHDHYHIPYHRSPLNCTCPETFYQRHDKCHRTIALPQEQLCPPGYKQRDYKTCVQHSLPEERCPFGFARVKQECVRRDLTIPQLGCPDGYDWESSGAFTDFAHEQLVCAKKYPVELEHECPDGSAYHGHCTKEVRHHAKYTCPAGYHQSEANTCYRVEDVSCGHPHGHPHSHIQTHPSGHPHVRRLNAETGVNDAAKELATGEVAGTFGAAAVAAADGRFGDALENARAALSAALGVSGRGGPAEEGAGGLLVAPVSATGRSHAQVHNQERLPGFRPWKGDGFHVSVPSTQAIKISQSCTANVTIPATPYCKVGTLRGNICIERAPVAPVHVCPAFGNTQHCYAYDRVNPKSECPHGFHQECAVKSHVAKAKSVDCQCIRTVTTPVEIFCPPGSNLINGKCNAYTSPFVGCPIGTKPVDGVCHKTETRPAICHYTVQFACEGHHCIKPDHKHDDIPVYHPPVKIHEPVHEYTPHVEPVHDHHAHIHDWIHAAAPHVHAHIHGHHLHL